MTFPLDQEGCGATHAAERPQQEKEAAGSTNGVMPTRTANNRTGSESGAKCDAWHGRGSWTSMQVVVDAGGTMCCIETPAKPRLRGHLHQWAFVASLLTGLALVVLAGPGAGRVAAAVYAVSVSVLFGTSALYHRRAWTPRARELM